FPSQNAYRDPNFSVNNLVTLAAKTTCKDRWRQVLNEADRLKNSTKYLFTLQRGISETQMDEMQAEKIVLVVPEPYIREYPEDRRNRIWTLAKFVDHIKMMEAI
ncbi:MAG TPA: restriction endonuclease, partial [Lachnospiraceae bacterium]|nr:restriction endonuclease [Lachnospiraceae bacterium]